MLDIDGLVAALTLEEKASLVSGGGLWNTRAVERLGIPALVLTDGPHGVVLRDRSGDAGLDIEHSAPATCFPTASGLGSSWNPELIRRVGEALGRECVALGVDVLLGPGVNIKRTPLCGRNFEYFAEDPLLAAEAAAAWTEGVQSQGVGASLKHFAANNQEAERMRVSAQVDERTLREIYLAAFEPAVRRARPWTVMCSYNRLNGVYASQHEWLLTQVLREDWGFTGVVVSDWGAVHDPVAALAAGLDLEMPGTGQTSPDALVAAVRAGELDEALLDRAVGRYLGLVQAAGERGGDAGDVGDAEDAGDGRAERVDEAFDLADHHALAREAARESAVLLKNEGGLLPLAPDQGGRIAVVGEFARSPRFQGGGSSRVTATRVDAALDAIHELVDGRREIVFEPGYVLGAASDLDQVGDPDALRGAALAAARDAECVLVFLGLPVEEESEGFDRRHLSLPEAQLRLLRELAAANGNVAVVLANGGVVETASWDGEVRAVLEAWLGGQAGGGAIADLVFGLANPSGRLAETIPVKLTDTPAYLNYPGTAESVLYGERVYVGYRYYDTLDRAVAYPFGHGLSYTSFEYSDLVIEHVEGAAAAGGESEDGDVDGDVDGDGGGLALAVTVSATVRNTGERAGQEVVQLYVADPESSVDRPARELKAFAKPSLAPGESATVSFTLDERAFAFYSERFGRWLVESGEFVLSLGASSRDLRLSGTLSLEVEQPSPPLSTQSTVGEWLEHPVGGPALRALAVRAAGEQGAAAFEEPIVSMLTSMPLASVLALAGLALPDGTLDELVSTANAA